MIYQFLALLAVHWLADFVMQTHWQAQNKSKSNIALAHHVITYTAFLGVAVPGIFFQVGLNAALFVLVNGALHFVTDWLTSRASSKLYAKQDWHNFFVVIGFDQLIHQFTLAGTVIYFFGATT